MILLFIFEPLKRFFHPSLKLFIFLNQLRMDFLHAHLWIITVQIDIQRIPPTKLCAHNPSILLHSELRLSGLNPCTSKIKAIIHLKIGLPSVKECHILPNFKFMHKLIE